MLKTLRDFTASVTDLLGVIHSVSFRRGSIIAEPRLEAALLELNCPVAPVADKVMVACQKCGTVFDRTLHPCEAIVTMVNTAIPYGTQFFVFREGEIILYPWLVEALRAANVPLATVIATKCPRCQYIFH